MLATAFAFFEDMLGSSEAQQGEAAMIRAATEADVDAIAHVHVAAWRETYPGIMPREVLDGLDESRRAAQWRRWFESGSSRGVLLVRETDGEIVGFASGVLPDGEDEGELETLYLLRLAQGHGDGRRLMAETARCLHDLGARSLTLWVADGNPTAGFYRHLGGSQVETVAKPFGPYTIQESRYRWHDISELMDVGPVI